ncbi:hypothetical protein KUTeg_011838 [Tegillarca granosa]|uniref:EF-hand domain-containing protein n=1 Tax=Tegillarca granosa TaxID=220873 RepID=A0ABQ9F339_TEGGR|nr:hypothetical protein KUTeg_011838 [Tegillarca granosa]
MSVDLNIIMALIETFQGKSPKIDEVDTSTDMVVRELTTEERKELKEMFSKHDDNGDNRISIREARSLLKALGMKPTLKDIRDWMRKLGDNNGDDYLSFKEFENLIKHHISTMEYEEAMMRAAFRRFDLNGDGSISKKEIVRILKETNVPNPEEEADRLIEEADLDGDGEIDYKEFCHVLYGTGNHE